MDDLPPEENRNLRYKAYQDRMNNYRVILCFMKFESKNLETNVQYNSEIVKQSKRAGANRELFGYNSPI